MSKLFAKVTLLGCAVAVSLVATEIVLQLLPTDQRRESTIVFDGRIPQEYLQPAMRLGAAPGKKAEGTMRMLVVGDSFAFAGGVEAEDGWVARLDRRLRVSGPTIPVEVVNWSRPGWNTEAELESVRANLDQLEPDLILLQFTLNDPEPSDAGELDKLRYGLSRRTPTFYISRWLYGRSLLHRRVWEAWENIRIKHRLRDYYRKLFLAPETWGPCTEAILGFRDLAAARSAPLLLVIFPVFDSDLDQSYAYRRLHQQVESFARKAGIQTLDLLPVYQGLDGRRLAVEPYTDPHPSEFAHRLATQAVLEHLQRTALVPGLSRWRVSKNRGRRWQPPDPQSTTDRSRHR